MPRYSDPEDLEITNKEKKNYYYYYFFIPQVVKIPGVKNKKN